MNNTPELHLNDVINDRSKYFGNIYDLRSNDDTNEIRTSFNDSQYYSESEFLTLLKDKNITDGNNLKLFNINIANVLTKLNSLKLLICNLSNEQNKPNIISVTETHLNDNQNHGFTSNELENLIPGYKFFNRNRRCDKFGGVGVFVDKALASEAKIERDDFFIDEIFEGITLRVPNIRLERTKKDLIVLTLYRQPKNRNLVQFHEQLQKWLNVFDKRTNEIFITGDLNLDLLKYQIHTQTSNYLDLMMSHSLLPVITRPTRIVHSSATLIDHFFCKSSVSTSGILACEIAGTSGVTDHYPVFCLLKIRGVNENIKEEVKFSYFTPEGHRERREGLKNENWDDLFATKDPDTAYQLLQEKYSKHYMQNLTEKTVKRNKNQLPRAPWMTGDILRKMRKRDRLVKNKSRRDEYRRLRNEIVNDCRKAEKNYYKSKIADSWNDIKGHWDILKQVMGKTNNKNEIPEAFKVNNSWVTDKQTIANCFNDFYSRIGLETNESVGQSNMTSDHYLGKSKERSNIEMLPTTFTDNDVTEAYKMLNTKKSEDAYGLSQKVVIHDMDILTPMFTHLANLSLSNGICPDQSKVSRVIPVFKNKGESFLFTNYRPISLIPIFSKILEKLIYNKIFQFLVRQETFYKSQYGFMKGRNTTHATLDFLQTVETAFKNNEVAIGIFVDLSKAFDTLDHSLLLAKLDHYGIRGNWLSWFKSYLSNRRQYVDMYGKKSNQQEITVGVPQGSILGPLLFLIYINDLPAALSKLIPVLFADDTNLIIKGKNVRELVSTLNNELESLNNYFKANKLKLNTDKTKVVFFRKKRSKISLDNLDIIFDGKKLSCEKNVTFLGMVLDEHLTWVDHCSFVANKMARNAGIINRVKKVLPTPSLQLIYNSLIFSHYSYGLEVWGAHSKALDRICGIQKKALRSVTKSHWLAHTEPRMKTLEILNVTDQYQVQCLNTTYDMLNGRGPDIFQFRDKIRSNNTRHNLRSTSTQPSNLGLPHVSTDKHSFSHLAPSFWNNLPEDIKNVTNRYNFRKLTKKHYLQTYKAKVMCYNPLCVDNTNHLL